MESTSLVVFLVFPVWFVGLVWALTDAMVNSSENALLWGTVVGLGGLIGFGHVPLLEWIGALEAVTQSVHAPDLELLGAALTLIPILLYGVTGRDELGTNSSMQLHRTLTRARPSGTYAVPSHICRNCGEGYHLERASEIDTCRTCGGIRVEKAS